MCLSNSALIFRNTHELSAPCLLMIILCLCTALHSSFLSVCNGSRPFMCSSQIFQVSQYFWDQCQANRAVALLSSPGARTHTSFPGREGYLHCFIAAQGIQQTPYPGHRAQLQPLIWCFMLPCTCFCNCIELLDMWTLDCDSFFRYHVILKQEQVILRQERVISVSNEICVNRKETRVGQAQGLVMTPAHHVPRLMLNTLTTSECMCGKHFFQGLQQNCTWSGFFEQPTQR